ncbi:GGDEF domain-containing protein [candidate division KSB1 bacterium]|nr:GGDEF domain-containing protein [candidate division KSB1 bacterium]
MDSIYSLIHSSQHREAWRRFRLPTEDWQILNSHLRSRSANPTLPRLPYPLEGYVSAAPGPHEFACVAEPAIMSPGPFREAALQHSIALTTQRDAVDSCRAWFGLSVESAPMDAADNAWAQLALIDAAERTALTELEARVMRAVRLADVMDLEGEPLFLSLSKMVQHLFAPTYLEIQPDLSSDFWSERDGEWVWHEPKDLPQEAATELVPRHKLALYRRNRISLIDECATAAEFTRGKELHDRGYVFAVLVPLVRNDRRLGVLKLLYASPLTILPVELDALELFRAEFSTVFDCCSKFSRTQRLATIDGLTQLFNHRFLREQLRTEFQRAKRYKKMMTFVMIDIDDFKTYNDTYGHLAGDRVLAEVAATIRSSVRDIDFVARYGGEEFALILPEITAENGLIVADKIRKAIEARSLVTEEGESMGAITVSCGVTDNRDAAAPEDLISGADRALYWVKRHGRNLVKLANVESQAI